VAYQPTIQKKRGIAEKRKETAWSFLRYTMLLNRVPQPQKGGKGKGGIAKKRRKGETGSSCATGL